jgi:hypothetical protein
VFHDRFGYGQVADVDGNKLTVDFEKASCRKVVDSIQTAARGWAGRGDPGCFCASPPRTGRVSAAPAARRMPSNRDPPRSAERN